jgi:glyoxylase-like metal-dependent hydrolase (beta-lactamase superfamily II)
MKSLRVVYLLLAVILMSAEGFGQGLGPMVNGIDFSGSWYPGRHQEAGLGTAAGSLVDYGGIPINEASRIYALSWPASRQTVRQHQCQGYVPPYYWYAPGNYRIWEDRDPDSQRMVALNFYGQIAEGERKVYVDGRPHPPAYAPHTFTGFSTGKYEGHIFTVTTTHLKRGWIRSTGVTQSDEATVVEHYIRHGDRITIFAVTTDPIMLTEPFSKTSVLVRSPRDPDGWLYACDDGEQVLDRPPDYVPSHLFGRNPFVRDYADANKVPLLGALGGAETMSPDFISKVKDTAAADRAAMAKVLPTGPALDSHAVDPTPKDGQIHTFPVQGSVYLLAGDGGNIAVQVGTQGALVVDAGAGKLSDKVIEAIGKISRKPTQFIVNTSYRADHTGGNAKVSAAGSDASLTGSFFSNGFPDAGQTATIIAHQNVENHLLDLPAAARPSDTFINDRRRKYHNEEPVEIFPMPNAVTDSDSIVHFRRSDVIVTGDIFDTTRYPMIDLKNGGSLQGEIKALNFILDRTVYIHDEDGGTMIVPGHGRITDEWEVAEYRDMLVIIRDRVQDMIKKGSTLEQVKAAKVSADYDTRFGATSGPWTTDMFVEAVYNSLKW